MIPKPEFPRPDREREAWLNLNGEWDFALYANAETAPCWEGKITVPFSWTCPLSGVRQNVAGTGVYRRKARFEAKGRVFLCVGAADYVCEVSVNGVRAGAHRGGYTPFEFDVSELWREGENEIEMRCTDLRARTQTYGKQGYGDIQGVWQTVWLEDRPETFLRNLRTRAKCDGSVVIEADAHCAKAGSYALGCAFGNDTAEAQVELTEGENVCALSFTLEKPRLWSPDEPNLYEGWVRLGEDRVRTYFGVREIGAAKLENNDFRWITLNGEPVYLNGTLDQAFNPKGHFTYPSDWDARMEAWRLKRLGLNMARIHIKPEEPRKLYWMDKLGVLIIQDMPCFWGEPVPEAMEAYESEWPDVFARDYNHPSIFQWVMFNESWGLLSGEGSARSYLPETQEWVRSVYKRAKAKDSTRLVEDNSPCRLDHVETDVNTWHFYINGYERVRKELKTVTDGHFPGSAYNCIGENRQSDAPLMNSECGMVWGVKNSAGDSDIAWQYHYMLNEFRLHSRMCGFVFTEFHDVVNEFNGYYRIDDTDKDFGYQDYCRGMSLRDLHAKDFVALDCPPCQTVQAGERVIVPAYLSSFSLERRAKPLTISWELWHEGLDGRVTDDSGKLDARILRYGTSAQGEIVAKMPKENALAVLSCYLTDGEEVVSRNFVTFDVRAALPERIVAVPVDCADARGFSPVWRALGGAKLCLGGGGEARYGFDLTPLRGANGLTLFFEAGAKRVLTKDLERSGAKLDGLNLMLGDTVDRGKFQNSYWMTDENRQPCALEVIADGELAATLELPNDPADARGALSWHAQPTDDWLDEAGSYGYLQKIELPSRVAGKLLEKGRAEITLRVKDGGLALYDRDCGRYAVGLWLRGE